MALQYGLNNAVDFESSKIVSFASVLSRTAGQPMDKSQLWYPLDGKTGLERAQEYAKTASAYVGQELAVIDVVYDSDETTVKSTSVKFYGIQDAEGTLKELGAAVLGDNASIAVAEDGKIGLYGFGNALAGTLPQVKQLEGGSKVIEWVPISSIVEGDGNSITTLTAGDNSLEITNSATDGFEGYKYSIKAKIAQKDDNILQVAGDGLYVPRPEQTDYSITVSTDSPESTSVKHYVFKQNGAEIAHIDIPKDLVVQSGSVVVADEEDVANDASVVSGDTYIKLVIANQDKPIYIAAKSLVDIYTGEASSTATVTISADNKISVAAKISAEAGNSLVAKTDGLYVNAPTIPNISVQDGDAETPEEDTVTVLTGLTPSGHSIATKRSKAATVAYVDKKVGEIVVPTIPDVSIEAKTAIADSSEDSIAVIVGLSASGHKITPSTQKVATAAALAAVKSTASDLTTRVTTIEDNSNKNIENLVTGDDAGQLNIEKGAQVNKIESVVMPDQTLAISNKSVSIPLATAERVGVVKSSTAVNQISYSDGIGEVNSLSTDKLVQGTQTLVLDGGAID